jgi:hypothetical protein
LRSAAVVLLAGLLASLLIASPSSGAGSGRAPAAQAGVAKLVSLWRSDLRRGAVADPSEPFADPSRAWLIARIEKTARRANFELVKVEMLHPLQGAPLIVTQWPAGTDASPLAPQSAVHVLESFIPTSTSPPGGKAPVYEGSFVEALTDRGIPFWAGSVSSRGLPRGRSWAADKALFASASHG